jgi:hypothetical protein
MFDLPTRGTEVRIPALLECGDNVEVVFAYARSSKIAALTVRSGAEISAAKVVALHQSRVRHDCDIGKNTLYINGIRRVLIPPFEGSRPSAPAN